MKQLEKQELRQLEIRIVAEKSLVERVRLKLQLKQEFLNEVTSGPKSFLLGPDPNSKQIF